eukprot:5163547-Pyramimonas_sp.AAC.1
MHRCFFVAPKLASSAERAVIPRRWFRGLASWGPTNPWCLMFTGPRGKRIESQLTTWAWSLLNANMPDFAGKVA